MMRPRLTSHLSFFALSCGVLLLAGNGSAVRGQGITLEQLNKALDDKLNPLKKQLDDNKKELDAKIEKLREEMNTELGKFRKELEARQQAQETKAKESSKELKELLEQFGRYRNRGFQSYNPWSSYYQQSLFSSPYRYICPDGSTPRIVVPQPAMYQRSTEPCVKPVRVDAYGRLISQAPRARAICVGLDKVDPDYYRDWQPAFKGCKNDAFFMSRVAEINGFHVLPLINEDASWPNLYHLLWNAAQEMQAGDTLLLTFSGPGGEALVHYGRRTGHSEKTWCLYNGQVFLDELKYAFSWFPEGVNIVVVADTGYVAGDNARALPDAFRVKINNDPILGPYYTARWRQYRHEEVTESAVQASVVMFTACHDDEAALEDGDLGVFTKAFLNAWLDAGSYADYRDLHQEIYNQMKKLKKGEQVPTLVTMGKNASMLAEQAPLIWFADRGRTWYRW